MESLEVRAAGCTRCALAESRQRVVIGSGKYDARLAIIGEAPGRSEDEGGAPFIGASGKLLLRLISEEVGLSREECYITNAVKCRPPANRVPTRDELMSCRPWFDEQWAMLGARVVLTVGNTATRYATGTLKGISEVRGRPVTIRGHVVVATFHPAAALRGGRSVEEMMRQDLRTVAGLLADSA